MTTQRAPAGLGKAGKNLWSKLTQDYEYLPFELALLELAARQADDIAGLEELLRSEGLSVTGSKGQPRLSAVVTELRQSRLALTKMLGALAVPDDDDQPTSETSKRARHAANARWDRQRRLTEQRVARGSA